MKKALAAGLLALLLAGCQVWGVTAMTSGGVQQGAAQPEPVEAMQLDEQLLRDYVQVYEDGCGGRPFQDGGRLSQAQLGQFLLAWMEGNGALAQYAVYDGQSPAYYSFPRRQLAELAELFFGASSDAPVPEDSVQVSLDELRRAGGVRVELSVQNGEWLPNGNYRLLVDRSVEGRSWRSAEYIFQPVLLEQEPVEMLKSGFSRGDTIYRFVSLRNLSAPASEQAGEMIFISTPQELAALAKEVNSGDWSYQNNAYKLEKDIDMFGVTMEPIGSYRAVDVRDPAPTGFCSIFDGQGHTIRNLAVRVQKGNAGMFSMIGRNGQVSNLNLENCEVLNQAGEEEQATGGLAGMLYGSVNRCHVSGQVSGNSRVGGLVGALRNGATVWNSRADAAVSGSDYVGGLAGEANGSRLYSCTASGAVSGSGGIVGGFIGSCVDSTIDRGIVSVRVQAPYGTGSVGYFTGLNNGTLSGCFYNVDNSAPYLADGGAQPGKESAQLDLSGLTTAQLQEMGVLS